MSQWFAPTKLVLSFETEGKGRFTPEEIETLVQRNQHGTIVGLNLPQKTVLIANHQVRTISPFPGDEALMGSRTRSTRTGSTPGR